MSARDHSWKPSDLALQACGRHADATFVEWTEVGAEGKVRVMVVDDHDLVLDAVSHILNGDAIEVVAVARNGEEAVETALEAMPDVTLMDVSMPVLDGIRATRKLLAALPHTRVIAFSSSAEPVQVLGALDAGAVGYLLKRSSPDELRRGVVFAAAGESPLAPEVASAVLAALRHRKPSVELSARERQVLSLVGEGLGNKVIAARLGISEKTVKVHLSRMFQRLGVADRTQAAVWAERNGLLDELA